MPKFFVMSDIHGFYDEMIKSLDEAGFDKDNEQHWVVTCGDHFDRGNQPMQVMEYLKSLPRKVLVRGNHEDLFLEMCQRGYACGHDISNGTAATIYDLSDVESRYMFSICDSAYEKAKDFIYSMVNYFETKNYIFVHSWIPLKCNDDLPIYNIKNRQFEFNPNWREAHGVDWEQARWGNPFNLVEQGLLPDKTIVFGHWHCSTGWAKSEGRSEYGHDAKFDPYFGDGFISIDACTAYSGKVNVVVLEDEFLED